MDGSAITNLGVPEYDGLIQDSSGNFIRGFHGSLVMTYVTHAEIMGIFQGISICSDMGVTRLVCYSDSSFALKLVRDANQDYHMYNNEIALIRDYMRKP